jgi:(S)-3,5-dihydroxyphenylglycine transaminase
MENESGVSVCRIAPERIGEGAISDSMSFLSEAAARYPEAISFAAGHPPNKFIHTERAPFWLQRYVDFRSRQRGDARRLHVEMGQYSNTSGTIQDLIAHQLNVEGEGVVTPQDIVVTNGFQEALLLHLLRIGQLGGAVVTMDPTYVGLTGAANGARLPLYAARGKNPVEALEAGIGAAQRDGHSPIVLYVISDFDNPTGRSFGASERIALLEIAERNDVLVLEDPTYRCFRYEGDHEATLFSLDRRGAVASLGTYSKSFLPGARIGFSAGPRDNPALIKDLVSVKSFLSVATSPISQGVVGGFLLDVDFRMSQWNAPKIEFCRANRDIMLAALEEVFGDDEEISWSRPRGGFYLTLFLPFRFDAKAASQLAERFRVIATPMCFFSPSGSHQYEARLSFSNTDEERIREGVRRLAGFVEWRMSVKASA